MIIFQSGSSPGSAIAAVVSDLEKDDIAPNPDDDDDWVFSDVAVEFHIYRLASILRDLDTTCALCSLVNIAVLKDANGSSGWRFRI